MTIESVRFYRRRLVFWGGWTGFGSGAIVDVILFHLVFQHHHLRSGSIDPDSHQGLQQNVFYDGLFLALMTLLVVVGLVMLWRTVNRAGVRLSGLFLAGALVVGAGSFNLLDGVINHYVLETHTVVHSTTAWNPHWLVVSLLLVGVGVGLLRFADGPISG